MTFIRKYTCEECKGDFEQMSQDKRGRTHKHCPTCKKVVTARYNRAYQKVWYKKKKAKINEARRTRHDKRIAEGWRLRYVKRVGSKWIVLPPEESGRKLDWNKTEEQT